ncbi:unnamed protein product [Pseudo-nitzschia multistriata]|uniref:Uncharacterized protein n=1 Tax=Pseudo-nitzschia multistriata TaxID=183589 RepID=A0A448ZAB8_9STRA|nr:unnamed protein product [Pseudo-nitzschia multistriata]
MESHAYHEFDPQGIEKLLQKELYELSVEDRNDILEEIHGVRCVAVPETPQLLSESLMMLENELRNTYASSPTKTEHAHYSRNEQQELKLVFQKSLQYPNSYIHQNNFRLSFLRYEFFDIRKAARRMVKFMFCVTKYFGDYALQRKIVLSDFTKPEIKVMKLGHTQLLPFRDRSGRRIVCVFPDADYFAIDYRIRIKIALYMNFVMGSGGSTLEDDIQDDADTQRKGAVFLVWMDSKSKPNIEPPTPAVDGTAQSAAKKSLNNNIDLIRTMGIEFQQASTVRVSAMHMCTPDTPLFRLQRSLISLSFGPFRSRLCMHLGEAVEVHYVLKGYGIPTEQIPISYSGNIKTNELKRWCATRSIMEDPSLQTSFDRRNLVEFPRLIDVVFKNGTSAYSNPGNVHFRSLMEWKYEELQHKTQIKLVRGQKEVLVKHLINGLLEEIEERNLRLLNWNAKDAFWCRLCETKLIRKKLSYIVQEFLEKSLRDAAATKSKQVSQSATSIFLQDRSPHITRSLQQHIPCTTSPSNKEGIDISQDFDVPPKRRKRSSSLDMDDFIDPDLNENIHTIFSPIRPQPVVSGFNSCGVCEGCKGCEGCR